MTRDETDLPIIVAPPLSPEASFDVDVATAFDVVFIEPLPPAAG